MTWAAIAAIALAFVGKLGALLSTIPVPVMGGIMLLLFGIIASIGISTLVREKVDLTCPRNLVIVSMILVFSIGGMTFNFGGVPFSGIGLGAINWNYFKFNFTTSSKRGSHNIKKRIRDGKRA